MAKDCPFVSRGGLKLDHALRTFQLDITGFIAADFGCSTGGFTDCLLQRGAAKVYAVDTGYGVLDWKLRNDPRVIVMERTNAMHVTLPEQVNLVAIDAGWTRQANILPKAASVLRPAGQIVSLIKPHYESEESHLRKGVLPRERIDSVLESVRAQIKELSLQVAAETESPILGAKGNVEFLFLLAKNAPTNLHECIWSDRLTLSPPMPIMCSEGIEKVDRCRQYALPLPEWGIVPVRSCRGFITTQPARRPAAQRPA